MAHEGEYVIPKEVVQRKGTGFLTNYYRQIMDQKSVNIESFQQTHLTLSSQKSITIHTGRMQNLILKDVLKKQHMVK